MIRFYEGYIAVKNEKENYLEELCNVTCKNKTNFRQEKIIAYNGCLLTEKQYAIILEHDKKNLVHSLRELNLDTIYNAYSDGASYNNGKKDPNLPCYGSYGIVILRNNEILTEESYGEENWSNNIGELKGAIEAIKSAIRYSETKNPFIILTSDSQYVIRGAIEWMDGWIKRGWKNNQGISTPNKELWKEMKNLIDDEDINLFFQWTRGHDNHALNEKCDQLATQYLKKLIKK